MRVLAAKSVSFCVLIWLTGCNGFHFRPKNIPRSAVWVDGTFIECSDETQVRADRCTVYKDDTGEILADGLFVLNTSRSAADKSELQYAAFGNGTIYLSDARRLVLWVPSERNPISRTIDDRLSAFAGRGATEVIECRDASGGLDDATSCALKAFGQGKAFTTKWYRPGIDSFGFTGFAGDANGNVYELDYDSMGWSRLALPKGVQLLDDNHTFVMPCPKPIALVRTVAGKLTCSRPAR